MGQRAESLQPLNPVQTKFAEDFGNLDNVLGVIAIAIL